MQTRTIATLLLCALLAPAVAAQPQERESDPGSLSAIGPDGEPLGVCPLEHTSVSVEISGFVARVVVTQVFSNPNPDPVEAVYTFPLSNRAAVDAMWMRTGDREIRGEIERREEARRRYEQARARGQLASLLDEERPNIFTQSLANLMPGARVEIEIHYVEPLRYEAGTFEFSFPTVVGPRFIPGTPTGRSGTGWAPDTNRVPDASRITPPVTPPGTRAGHDIDIAVEIDAGVAIHEIDSKLHEVDVDWRSSSQARVALRRRSAIPNRDFVLRYAVAADRIQSAVLTHREGPGEGFASFVLLPPRRVTSSTAAPKEMIFVIDRSGSQSGRPLAKAKETLHWILDHMNPNDTFQIVDFGSDARKLFDRPQPASRPMKHRARAYIEGLRANGGTFMAEAIREVAATPADAHRLRIVTFMTDGYIGNDFEVIDLVRRLRGTSRWFPFGTGNSVNRFLLDNMAREGGGEVEYVLLDRPGEEVAKRFYERIASPVLTDVRLEFRGLEVENLHPDELGDVWAERPLVVHARYREPGRGRVVVHGYRRGRPYREELRVTLPDREERNAALGSMWARARVDALMRRDLPGLQSGRFADDLKERIVEVALAHRILTPFTSFVAVEDRVVNRDGVLRTVTVPVEMPQGVEYEGIFGEAYAVAPMPYAAGAAVGSSRGVAGFFKRGPTQADAVRERASKPVEELPQEEPKPLSEQARRRLAPELETLVLQGHRPTPGLDIVDGEVKVKVVLRDGSEAAIRALEALGLRILQRTDDYAIARIPVAALARLAESEHVERIEPV
jgi:Ca-activated chloride channel family protein